MKLSKIYEPNLYEADIDALWEKSGAFTAHPEKKAERFSIAMPPPNATGTLSLGHALFLTLQDIMARHARQQGKDVLWLPGTDHAALANALLKSSANEGTTKHEVGRKCLDNQRLCGIQGTMLTQMRAWVRCRLVTPAIRSTTQSRAA
jgi:valyl-tRNA synthetase